jgi:hypothetical protein
VENADFAVYGRSDALTYSEITQVNGVYPRAKDMKIGKKTYSDYGRMQWRR